MKLRIFFQLLRRDMRVYRGEYWGKFLDMLITFAVWNAVFGYLMPLMGTQQDYGVFIMVGALASFGIFEVIGKAGRLMNDIQGDRTISYLLLLPVSPFTIFSYIAISWAIQTILAVLPLYIVGKLLFWNQFTLATISWWKLPLAFITTNLFFGFFSLWIAAAMAQVKDLGRIYFRFINPLFIFGCYFFPWAAAWKFSEPFAIAILFDPFTYAMEIMRAAILGQEGSLPFWASFGALWGFTLACAAYAIRRLKKHLDCV